MGACPVAMMLDDPLGGRAPHERRCRLLRTGGLPPTAHHGCPITAPRQRAEVPFGEGPQRTQQPASCLAHRSTLLSETSTACPLHR